MKRIAVGCLLCLAALSVAQSRFNKVQFIFFRSSDGKPYNPPRQLTVTGGAEIAKLLKFMPGVGLSKSAIKPGGWAGWGMVRLMRAKGAGIQVFFPADGKVYSMVGKYGDFPASKGFKDYLLDVEKRAKQ